MLTTPSKCPTCNYELPAETCIKDANAKPKAGDLSVCLNCGEILVFDPDLKLRMPTISDVMSWDADLFKQVSAAQKLIRQTRPLTQKKL